MDLSKLTPAPWEAVYGLPSVDMRVYVPGEEGDERRYAICATEEKYVVGPEPNGDDTDALFIALARNAFDVMMRRGWGVAKELDGWSVFGNGIVRGNPGVPDPFTALVEADKWYAAHVEGGKE